jgi:type IV secretion system protein VirD4
VVSKKVSISRGKGGRSRSTSIAETSRPLLTTDECLRLPGPTKNSEGHVTAPGDMLIFTAGQSPIYGRQILYFIDPVFSARAKIAAPVVSDSLYTPSRLQQKPVQLSPTITAAEYEKYLRD